MPGQLPLQHWLLLLQPTPLARPHLPAKVPVGQQTSVPGQVSGVPVHVPLWQLSSLVHGFASLQLAPFGLFSTPQTPAVQVACWHWLLGFGQSAALWQRTQPGIGVYTHVLLVWLQVSVVHGLLSLHCAFVVQQPAIAVC